MNQSSQFVRDGRSLLTRLAKPDKPSLLPPSLIAGAFIAFLTLADLATLKTLFNATFTDQPAIIWVLSLVGAVLLDVPMSVAGLCVSQCIKGMRGKVNTILVTVGCLTAFLIALVLCLDLRMNTRDIVFTGIGASQGGLVDLAGTGDEETPDTSEAVRSAAQLLSFLPVATSMAAFIISLALSDPQAEQIGKLEAKRRALQDAIARTDAFFAECGDTEKEMIQRIQREEELYSAFLSQINDQVLQIKQAARIMLMEKAGTPDAITRLTESAGTISRPLPSETNTAQLDQPVQPESNWYAA